ncbi:MAG: FtsX-like permease family protein [Candidatus Electrothrix sp. AX5]|nr:FtsX-like permease family protein [Candidatus Electrothrix sp. AX5]
MLPPCDDERRSAEVTMLLTYVREAIRSLYTAKQRTLLALIGISIAIGAVIALVSIGVIWGEEMLKKYSALGPDILHVMKDWRDRSDKQISVKDAQFLLDYTPTLVKTVPVLNGRGSYFFKGHRGRVSLEGTVSSYKIINKLRLKSGRFISDFDENKAYVVLGSRVLDKPEFRTYKDNAVGATIKIDNRPYSILGILEKEKIPWGPSSSVLMPISTANRVFGEENGCELFAQMRADVDYQVATQEIEKYFKQQKKIKIRVLANEQLIEQAREQAEMHTLLLGFISSISLLVGGVGIMNVMLTSVMDRRREIGILRAIGARQRDIRRQFLTEAVILSLIGGILGAGLGILSCYIVCSINKWTFFIPELGIWLGVGVSSLVGIFFGFYPAHKAAKLDPITALRSE